MLKVQLDQFNGPLDLLLSLIKKEKLDITQISLEKIADQYLSYVEQLKNVVTDEVADFLLVAAKLIFIKSKALLPEEEKEEEDKEELLQQLKIYKQYLEASKKINKIIIKGNFLFARNVKRRDQIVFNPSKNLKISILHKTFKNFLNNLEKDDFIIGKDKIIKKISVYDKIKEINFIMKKAKKFVLNQSTFWTFKSEKIVGFLAVLELIKDQNILVKQEELFADIIIFNV
ncbi:MAG: segregation/condensation protein A [Xanthomonadaceae bacterium]|nr:segregation/condensation protein A [Rhodospirillaceae bacterium]NIA17721.1 segregation/condensation protein A [Xanthomonadaceae bacterium]